MTSVSGGTKPSPNIRYTPRSLDTHSGVGAQQGRTDVKAAAEKKVNFSQDVFEPRSGKQASQRMSAQADQFTAKNDSKPIPGTGPVKETVGEKDSDGLIMGAGGQLYGARTSLLDVPPFKPDPAKRPPGAPTSNELIVHINGIQNDQATQQKTLEALANKTGSPVIGIHNATGGAGTVKGFVKDILQCTLDKAGMSGLNPATVTAGQAIYQSLKKGQPVHVMAHSQGALITSGALTLVKNQLESDAKSPGAPGAQARQMLERFKDVRVETFGGAADSYPAGPQYVHYINTTDLVTMTMGLGEKDSPYHNDIRADARPSAALNLLSKRNDHQLQQAAGGPGSVVHFVFDYRGLSLDMMSGHDFMQEGAHPESGGYLAQRVPFEQARRGQFKNVDTHR